VQARKKQHLDKLRSTPDGEGYGAALSDADLHLYTDLSGKVLPRCRPPPGTTAYRG
jgi:hypothetical protein